MSKRASSSHGAKAFFTLVVSVASAQLGCATTGAGGVGFMSLTTVRDTGTIGVATFLTGSPPVALDPATLAAYGALGCPADGASPPPASSAPMRAANAGEVRVFTRWTGPSGAMFTSNATGTYLGVDAPLYGPGDRVVVRGSGSADLPPFELEVVAPPVLSLTEPSCGAPRCGALDRRRDLLVRWPPADGLAALMVGSTGCLFDARKGEGLVRASVLARQPPGVVEVRLWGQRTAVVERAGFRLSLSVAAPPSSVTFELP